MVLACFFNEWCFHHACTQFRGTFIVLKWYNIWVIHFTSTVAHSLTGDRTFMVLPWYTHGDSMLTYALPLLPRESITGFHETITAVA